MIASMNPISGGPCQGIRNSVPELERQQVYNEVVCLDDPGAAFLLYDAFPIHALGPAKGPWNYSGKLVPWLMDNFCRFDIIIVHGLWLYHSYAVSKTLNIYKSQLNKHNEEGAKVPKLFVMPHGMLDPYFQKAAGRKLKAVRNWVYWKLIERKVVNEADGILFTCEEELQLARLPFHPYHPKREINVGYGITAPPLFNPAMRNAFLKKCPELENRPYFLFLSRIHEKKGVDFLIKAYSEVVSTKLKPKGECSIASILVDNAKISEFQDNEWPVLVIAGPGLETSYGVTIQQLAADSINMNNSVLFPGMLTGDAKWGAFYGCEAFVLPSHQENFGIAVAEALACFKPVLISNKVNIWQEVEEKGGGIVTDDSLEGTKDLLNSWQALSKKEKQEMSRKARKAYEELFAIEPHAARLLNSTKF